MMRNREFQNNMLDKYGLRQVICHSTTIEGTLTDVAFTNIDNVQSDVVVNTWSTHHTVIIYVPEVVC